MLHNNKEHTHVEHTHLCTLLISTLCKVVVLAWSTSAVGLVKKAFVAEDIATPT